MKHFRSVCALAILAGAFFLPALRAADLRALISRADLDYPAPVARSEDGLPVGNGRMGSLVWTTPTALKFQINRVAGGTFRAIAGEVLDRDGVE